MYSWRPFLRALAAAWLLSACGSAPSMTPAASGTVGSGITPPRIWQDVRQLRVLCLVATPAGVDPELQRGLCGRVRALAEENAPMPVAALELGDPAALQPDGVTLLVHASVTAASDGRLIAFYLRPHRLTADQDGLLFTAAPRAVRIPASGPIGPALDEALRAALSETLPWQARTGAARPIS